MLSRTSKFIVIATFLLMGCGKDHDVDVDSALFKSVDVAGAGITFANNLAYTEEFNVYTFRNFYNGAGVGLGDFDRDGLVDIFFCGNQVDNELYLNKGDFQFENITASAGVASKNVWTTGVSVVDINGDGWLDIYVCKSGDSNGENRHNELFINNGLNDSGVPSFTEKSKEYGLDDVGLATHAAFLDYDLDGDLDCYLLNNSFRSIGNYDLRLDQRKVRDTLGGNKLLRNNTIGTKTGDRIFEDVSEQAGIYGSAIGFGLGVTFGDVNEDGYPDIYVSNDFFEKDYLYINRQDGTFNEESDLRIREMSMGSMGADMADINNDGLQDIFVTEMLPRTEKRKKSKSLFEDWNKHQSSKEQGYHQQFARNVLQLNIGNGQFSEVGRMAEVEATDWSWGALIFDIDNDGWKDLFVANGIYKDLLDQDYINFYSNPAEVRKILFDKENGGLDRLIDLIPSEPVSNYVFRNEKQGLFSDKTREWGIKTPTFSNGSAYGDLDNDGDLDLVINNINSAPIIYENTQADATSYLQISLIDSSNYNYYAIGAEAKLYTNQGIQVLQVNPARGFMSTVDARLHFGMRAGTRIDSVVIRWPDLKYTTLTKVTAQDHITIHKDKRAAGQQGTIEVESLLDTDESFGPDFMHQENDYSDFDREPLLLDMKSNLGPAVCAGDINNDGLTDFYIGGASGQFGVLFIQLKSGKYKELTISVSSDSEEVDCIFYDSNGDGQSDLYVASGSSEFGPNNVHLMDRLYVNLGNDKFEWSGQVLPTFNFENTSSVSALDYDSDGDQDLVVSTFTRPYSYGLAASTYLLENDGQGIYKEVTKQKAPELMNIGMVSSTATGDVNGDGTPDLVIAGDWMPILVLTNRGGTLRIDSTYSLFDHSGLWSTLKLADLDGDGDQDIIAGNRGLNARHRASLDQVMKMYINDFDQNGKVEQVFSYTTEAGEYPVAQRSDLLKQLPYLSKKYPDYASYAGQRIEDIFSPQQLESALVSTISDLKSAIYWNEGSTGFRYQSLPTQAQRAPVYAIEVIDINGDGYQDIIVGGNQSLSKPEHGSYMASHGLVMLGSADGTFVVMETREAGLFEQGEIRGIRMIHTSQGQKILIAKNDSYPIIYKQNESKN